MKKFVFLTLTLSLFITVQTTRANGPAETLFSQRWEGNEQGPLKAILVVGPQEDGTAEAIKEMDRLADFLHDHGVRIRRFYDEDANWDEITAISRHANIFVYAGHGSARGPNGTGGLSLQTSISNTHIVEELELAPNAIVLFQSVCRGAGSSAGDDGDIGVEAAGERVTEYAKPFFSIGASVYYANNYQDGCLRFMEDLFEGKTLEESYLEAVHPWNTIEFSRSFPSYSDRTISISSNPGGGKATRITYINGVRSEEEIIAPKGYDVAYAGPPGFTLSDLTEIQP